jgi:endonuclease/exonuclease/phosphatase (EEP) superfamily protein YafD
MLTSLLSDAWLMALDRRGPEMTVHGFGKLEGRTIDWVLYRDHESPVVVETVTTTKYGLYPSDHFPVLAAFDVESATWLVR